MPFEKTIARAEAFLKGMMFDCHTCGQCVLSQTGMVCPMSCPKGLRNGPCGGTLDGKCEVYPSKSCVWVRIHNRTSHEPYDLPKLIASADASLYRTSSYLNLLNGKDSQTRKPLDYLDLPKQRTRQPIQTQSKLEQKLKSGQFVKLCELRSPREANFEHFEEQWELIREHFDAVNITAYLNGKPSLSSPLAARRLRELGADPICQTTCRDYTKTSFVAELIENQMNDVHNVLCLTGDSYAGTPKIKQVFDMDSSLMLYEARHIREHRQIAFTGQVMKNPPKPFLGAVINPFTTPMNVPIRRLKQKAAAGADFIQTQMVFEVEPFRRFMELVCQEKIDEDVFILAGVPVIISPGALKMLPHVPGVGVPPDVLERLQNAKDLRAEGLALACQTIREIRQIPGISGVHLMLMGSDHSVLKDVIGVLDEEIEPSTFQNVAGDTQPATQGVLSHVD